MDSPQPQIRSLKNHRPISIFDMSLKGIAQETLQILDQGKYTAPSGKIVRFLPEIRHAILKTLLYTPEEGDLLLGKSVKFEPNSVQIEVTDETTQVAAKRLVVDEGVSDLVLLNFASARNPGGGFINGAKAQEEDLARASGLYPCLLTQKTYYDANRSLDSLLYTDHLIYSPKVPWFRTHNREVLEQFFLASVITSPAPNAGQLLTRTPEALKSIQVTLRRRVLKIFAVAREHHHRTLLLGAWGCGVFRNDPHQVAESFAVALENECFRGYFKRVIFAVYDPSPTQENLKAFHQRFQSKIA